MKWVEFVKKFAKDNNIKYGEALKKAKDAWKKHKETSPEHIIFIFFCLKDIFF